MANPFSAAMMMQHSRNLDSPRPSSVGSSQSTYSNSSRSRFPQDVCVGEELKIGVHVALERFRMNEEQKEIEFPSSLTSTERCYIHKVCANLGMKSKSKGKGAGRYITVSKKDGSQIVQASASFQLARNSRHQVHTLMQRYPLTNKERMDLMPRTERGQGDSVSKDLTRTTTGRLNNGVPQVPPRRGDSDLLAFRETLPVMAYKDEITKGICNNKVILISGETGSGKTTQIPQFILDDSTGNNRPCRIICTQPRRISALSIAERVAAERGEKIGQTVGYQIRLESRVSPKTLLTFCTNGVLLRTLMGGDNSLNSVTHVIVDEVHERDRFCDFLLTSLRDIIHRYKHLKLILMSATLNTQLFSNYFNGCPVIAVPGKLYDVKEYFLEDVLKMTSYTNKEMEKYKNELSKVDRQEKQLNDWCSHMTPEQPAEPGNRRKDSNKFPQNSMTEIEEKMMEIGLEREDLEPWLIKEMDDLLTSIFLSGDDDAFNQVIHLIMCENVSVDYMHSETSATPLMIAAGRGFGQIVEQLLCLGANTNIRASNGWSALDWAKKFDRNDVIELLEAYVSASEEPKHAEEQLIKDSHTISPEDRDLLNIYHHSFDDDKVDLDLIMGLLYKIHQGSGEGAVLIFLPGYDEIISLRDKIMMDERCFGDNSRYILFTLHSNMQTTDQKKVFKAVPHGVRKIILSTNIAETSVTINDVVYVIDSGKVKEKSFDALTSVTTLKSIWISRASAQQRKGRAGRCRAGICYHLFSTIRHNTMLEYQDPEILRYPLQELCLHTKMLAPVCCPIADFLSRAPEPPAFLLTRNAVTLLKQIDALDQWEDLTELGHHLTDLPLEPRYGKMILYSVVLKCLDPILTISCTLAYRDPFSIPAQPSQKRAANLARRKFSAGTYSDHMALLRAFQAWQKARADGWERQFCQKNFISGATMEMILGMRTQLLGQLRASGFVRARGCGDIRDLNTNSENWAVVKAALLAGMYPNVIRFDRQRGRLTTLRESKVRPHYRSVIMTSPAKYSEASTLAKALKNLPTDWLFYEEMTRAQRIASVNCCTVVSPITLGIFAGPAKLPMDALKGHRQHHGGSGDGSMGMGGGVSSDSEGEEKDEPCGNSASLTLDDWISFHVDGEAAHLALGLRQKWHSLFMRRMRAPAKPWSQVDEAVIKVVVSVLTNEEQSLGLQQPAGIGQRPRPMSTDGMTPSDSRRGSNEIENQSDDSSHGSNYSGSGKKGGGWRVSTPPKRREFFKSQKSEDRSETSSNRSAASGQGSNSNSNSGSLRGSASSTPCTSPQPSGSPGKWAESNAHPSRFFVMKCNNHKNLDFSYSRGVWATVSKNEKALNKCLDEGKNVFLIFSVQGSGHFQGYAKLVQPIGKEGKSQDFNQAGLGGNFRIEWIKRANLPFQHCHHLLNPYNNSRRVQISRDGQEIEPTVGEQLIKLWERVPGYQGRPGEDESQGAEGYDDHRFDKPSTPKYGNKGFKQQWSPDGGHGYGHFQGGYGGYPGGKNMHSPRMSHQMGPHFNPMYVSPVMNPNQLSPSGMRMNPPQSVSPGQGMNPVMILQRGSHSPQNRHQGPNSSPKPHHHSMTPTSMGYQGGYYHQGN
ncbi:3'-5' RNA helicase YTHDC2-like [Lineus longissimus]|uniref:3'-5' RNA helicase YTHDC2-like n=1 Tax=Lineus longissimus TaxID=88925 RepID=UPI00315DBBA6